MTSEVLYYLCDMEIFEGFSAFELLVVVGSLVGAWVGYKIDYSKMNSKYAAFEATIKSRIKAMEVDNQEVKQDFKHILKEIQEIRLLLAKNKVE